jgi:hypothetical protein
MQTLATKSVAIPEAVLTKAVLNAAAKLGVTGSALAVVLGLSEATISRMKNREYTLEADTKSFEFGVLFVRLFRSLDAIVGGDEAVARAWLFNPNLELGGTPAEQIRTITGLMNVVDYLDACRAPV